MIRLLILIIVILFLFWLVSSLFFGNKKELNKKIIFTKSVFFIVFLIGCLVLFWLLPRLGISPLLLFQKVLPMLSFIKYYSF